MNSAESTAWNTFLSAHDRVLARLDGDLAAECDMTLAEYEVLSHLAEAPDRRLRMNELADLARLSPSGLTRRFDALARRGWVTRERCDDDRRGVVAKLTEEGLEQQKAAAPVHLRGARTYFLDELDGEQIAALASMMERVVEINAERPTALSRA
jgi:DNA-binding MarR family transcriptional regulator